MCLRRRVRVRSHLRRNGHIGLGLELAEREVAHAAPPPAQSRLREYPTPHPGADARGKLVGADVPRFDHRRQRRHGMWAQAAHAMPQPLGHAASCSASGTQPRAERLTPAHICTGTIGALSARWQGQGMGQGEGGHCRAYLPLYETGPQFLHPTCTAPTMRSRPGARNAAVRRDCRCGSLRPVSSAPVRPPPAACAQSDALRCPLVAPRVGR